MNNQNVSDLLDVAVRLRPNQLFPKFPLMNDGCANAHGAREKPFSFYTQDLLLIKSQRGGSRLSNNNKNNREGQDFPDSN